MLLNVHVPVCVLTLCTILSAALARSSSAILCSVPPSHTWSSIARSLVLLNVQVVQEKDTCMEARRSM